MRILIIEDEPLALRILIQILQTVPEYEIVTAENGSVAWDILTRERLPDLCILDIEMPGMSGLDLLEKMRGNPDMSQIQIILCSGRRDRETIARAAKLKVKYFILKPYQPELVLKQVSAIRQEIKSVPSMADPVDVARHLNISLSTCHALINRQIMVETPPILTDLRAQIESGENIVAMLRVRAMKGLCSSLGFLKLNSLLDQVESMLIRRINGLLPSPKGQIDTYAANLLDGLKQEHEVLLATVQKSPQAAPVPPKPAAPAPKPAASPETGETKSTPPTAETENKENAVEAETENQ